MTSYEDATQHFGDHIKHGGDWRYGGYVAQWVAVSNETGKVSARRFSETADVPHATVSRYLKAWNYAAEQGHVPSSKSINPGEDVELDVDDLPDWSDCYKAANKPANPKADPEPQPEESSMEKLLTLYKAIQKAGSEMNQIATDLPENEKQAFLSDVDTLIVAFSEIRKHHDGTY